MSDSENTQQQSETILFEKGRKVATITINRPEALNAITLDMLIKMRELMQACEEDGGVRIVRIKAADARVFSAGLDLKAILAGGTDYIRGIAKHGRALIERMLTMSKPIVAQVQAPAIGWGCMLYLASDMRILLDHPAMYFSLPELEVGIFPATGATVLPVMTMPFGQAKRLLLEGKKLTTEEFEAMGLVNMRLSGDEADAEALKFCQNYAKKKPVLVQGTKTIMNMMQMNILHKCFDMEDACIDFSTQDDAGPAYAFCEDLWKRFAP